MNDSKELHDGRDKAEQMLRDRLSDDPRLLDLTLSQIGTFLKRSLRSQRIYSSSVLRLTVTTFPSRLFVRSEESEMFFTVFYQWIDFADRLREALDRLGSYGEAEQGLLAI